MDVREKLVELLVNCEDIVRSWDGTYGEAADHLIAHGVTVQEWIPLSEQTPDRDSLVLVFFDGMRDTNCAIQVMYGWCLGGSASHWMPLPMPPKGE